MNPMFKTSMCHSMMNEGHCDRGMMCKYAHSPAEIRGPGGPAGPPMGMHGGNTNIMIHGSDGKIKYKTSMCTVFMEAGFCPRGEACGFAHSAKQLLEAQARDPKYKTAICETWKANGSCDRGSNCIYAHGQSDLRQKSQMPMQNMHMQNMSPMTTAYPPQYRAGNYKTQMCKNVTEKGHCNFGNNCQYAHSSAELRAKKPMGMMAAGMGGMAGMAGMGATNMFKR